MTDDSLRAFSGAVKHDSPNHYPSLKYRSGHHKPKGLATMTRDEAVTIIIDARYGPMARQNTEANACAHARVRESVRLGIIKLDEPPKSLKDRIKSVMEMPGIAQGELHERIGFLHWALECENLKIVEK